MDRKLEVGATIETDRGEGVIAYVGETEFSKGMWVGIILNEPKGLNNGTVKGVEYFKCEDKHGVFYKADQIPHAQGKAEPKSRMQAPSGLRMPAVSSRTELSAMKKKNSTASTPSMTPSSSTERLRSMESISGIGASATKNVGHKTGSKLTAQHSEAKTGTSKAEIKTPARPSNIGRMSMQHPTQVSKFVQPAAPAPSAVDEPEEDTEKIEFTPGPGDGVKDMIKKMEGSSMPAPVFVPIALPAGMDESSELEWLRIQHKDLSEKLETLRQKRKEDHGKLMELERCKIQVQGLEEFKIKMCEAHKELQKKLQEKERELRELDMKKSDDEGIAEIEERLEMVTLDREMAEEKAEILQAELDAQKEKVTELEMELEILRAEMEQQADPTLNQNAVVQVKQLEQQNLMLREGLVKLRDAVGQANAERQETTKYNETLKEENAAMVKLIEKLKQEATLAQETASELHEQVDAVMGSEEMIEKLTEKNLNMEEKIRTLEEEIADLETMRIMDEEILDTQKEAEKEMRIELSAAQCKISDLNCQLKADLDQAEEHDKVVQKFRQKIAELNHLNQDFTDQILRYKEQIQEMQEGEPGSGSAIGLITANRAFAEDVEKEIKELELESALQRANYLEAFLPDNFTKPGGDNDAVILNILFPRISRKTVALAKLLELRYPRVPGGLRREHITKSHKAEQWAHSGKFTYFLNALGAVARKFGSAIQRCSVERLSRLSQMHLEMSSQERTLDQYVDLLRMDRLDENTGTENLQKAISYFQNVFSVHMAGEWFDGKLLFMNSLSQVESGLNWLRINVQRLGFFLLPGQEESDVAQFETALLAAISECLQLILRARNRVPSEGEFLIPQQVSAFNHWLSVDDHLLLSICSLEKASTILDRFCSVASTQLSMLPDVEGLEASRLKEMLLAAIERTHGKSKDGEGEELVKNHLYNLRDSLVQIANGLEKAGLDAKEKEEKPFPPLLERAHTRKQDAVEAESLRWQVEKKEAEITELRKTIRSKNEDLSNFRLRLEMAQSKIESSDKADEVRVQMLQSRCDALEVELRKKQTEFDETIGTLHRDLTELEKENADLKERSRHMCKKTLLMNLNNSMVQSTVSSMPTTPLGMGGSVVSHIAEIEFLESELADKQQIIKYAESRIRQLKSRVMLLELAQLKPISLPKTICGPLTLLAAAQDRNKETLDRLTEEAESLFLEASKYQVPYVENFEKSMEVRQAEERRYNASVAHINQRIKDLKLRMQTYFAQTYAGEPLPAFLEGCYTPKVEQQKADLPKDDGVRGIHSERYKKAFNNLFGNLEAERHALEERRQATTSGA